MRSRYSRGLRVVGRDQVRAHAEAVLDAADRVRECAATVGETDAQRRQALEDAAEDQAAGGARLLCGHADQPGQPVFRHRFATHHVPGVDQDRGIEVGRGLEKREQLGRVEIPRFHM